MCKLGIQVAVEVAVGLGIFAGEYIGIAEKVRQMAARAYKVGINFYVIVTMQGNSGGA